MRASDYADKLRDPATERLLSAELSRLSDHERLIFIIEMLEVSEPLALRLAKSCLREKQSLRQLFELGISRVRDLSRIGIWLDHLVFKLGIRQIIHLLVTHANDYPLAVRSALYFLPTYIAVDDTNSRTRLEELRLVAVEKGIVPAESNRGSQQDSDPA